MISCTPGSFSISRSSCTENLAWATPRRMNRCRVLALLALMPSYTLPGMSVLALRSSALRMSSRATSMATLPPPITATFSAVSGVVTGQQVVKSHVLAEFHVAVQVDVRVVERLLESGCDEFDGRVVGGHAVAHQAERHRQLFEQVDAGLGAQSQLFAELAQLAQENIGRVDACGAGADYSNTKFVGFAHMFQPNIFPAFPTGGIRHFLAIPLLASQRAARPMCRRRRTYNRRRSQSVPH